MMWSDTDILKGLNMGTYASRQPWVSGGSWIIVSPIDIEKALQPSSIDLRLGDEFAWFPYSHNEVCIKKRNVEMQKQRMDRYVLGPNCFCLATTIEKVTLGSKVVGRIEGKSSLGRLGLMTHVTAGFIDPGFSGNVTLELYNVSPNNILLTPGAFICQIAFSECISESNTPYGSRGLNSLYQNQVGVQESRSHEDD